MSDTSQSLRLETIQQQLEAAQARVAQLEAALLRQTQSISSLSQDHSIFDSLLEGCQIVSFEWRYVYINNAAARHGQRSRDELIGYTMMECYPGIEHTLMFSLLEQCLQDRTVGRVDNEFVYPNGTSRWFEISVEPIPEGIFILSMDITERKQSEYALRRYAQRMEILHEIDTGIISATSIQEIVETALQPLRQLIGCQRVFLVLIDWITEECLVFADDSHQPYSSGREIRMPIPKGWDDGFGQSQTRTINDLRLESHPTPLSEQLIQDGLVAGLHTLLLDRGQRIGLLGLSASADDFFTAEHQEIAVEIANQLTIAIHQLQLSEELGHHSQTLEKMGDFLQTTLDAFPANATVLDSEGTIITFNLPWKHFADDNASPSRSHYLGANYLAICDQSVGPLSEEAAAAAAGIRSVIAGDKDEFNLEYPCHSATEKRWFMLRVTPFAEAVPRHVVVAHINITERKQAQNELEGLYDATSHLFSASNLIDLGHQIVNTVVRVFDQADCGLMLVSNKMIQRVARGGTYNIQPEYRLEFDGLGLVPLAIRTGQIVYAPDVNKTPNYVLGDQKTRSELVIPLKTSAGVIGALDLQHTDPDAFGDRDKRILTAYAERAAAAIENMRLYEEINQHAAELEKRVAERTNALNHAKQRVETILHNSLDAILLLGFDFSIQQVNTAFNQLFTCEPDDYFDKTLLDLIEPGDVNRVASMITDMLSGRIGTHIEARAQRKDGSPFDIELSIGYFKGPKDQGTEGFVCTLRDITQRKAQERQLRYHASLQQNMSEAVISTDMEFRIQSWNRSAERIYGWCEEEVIGKTVTSILRTEDSHIENLEHRARQLRSVGWWQGEIIQYHKDGSPRHILGSVSLLKDEQGGPFGVVAVNHDITERKNAERALFESEARYRLLAENVTDIISKAGPDGIRTYVTPSCYALSGYTPEELIGQPNLEIVHPDDRSMSHAMVMQALGSSASSFTLTQRIRHKAGHYIPVEVTSSIVRDPDTGQPTEIVAVIRDITERKLAEETLNLRLADELEFQIYLKELHEITIELTQIDDLDMFYRRAVELGLMRFGFERLALFLYEEEDGTALGTYGTDPDRRITDERHVRFIPSPTGIMHSALNRTERFYFEEDRPLYDNMQAVGTGWNVATVLWNGTRSLGWLIADNLIYHKPASKPLLDILGLYGLAIGTLLAQKQTQIALKESEGKYRSLIETMQGGLVMFDMDYKITYVNDRFCELLGYSRDEALGLKQMDFIDDAQTAQSNPQIELAVQNADSPFYEITVRHKDGRPVHLLISGSMLVDNRGNYNGSFMVATDITVQKQAEQTLRQALAKEKDLNELKSRFVSMASHEFRTPLATILALTETLSAYRHRLSEDQIEDRFGKIKDQINHLKDIMEDVLLLARMQARRVEFSPALLDLDHLCQSVLDEFQNQPGMVHHIDSTCHESLREVTLDRKLMRQIINNLVSNAIKYSLPEKPIQVSLDYVDDAVVLIVKDQGIGIPDVDIPHLFEPFHRASNVGTISGTGLGLVVIRECVELHGGTIAVESKVDEGTAFTIRIPLTP